MNLNMGTLDGFGLATAGGETLAGLVDPKIERVLGLARTHLRMDVSFLSEFSGGKQIYRAVDGAAGSFGIALGDGPDLAATYCQRMVEGKIPCAVPDSLADRRVRSLPVTLERGIGSYLGVPLRLSDGSLYGTFCCLSHNAQTLDDRDAGFMSMLADVLVEVLDTQQFLARERALVATILSTESLECAFQPIMGLREGRTVGFEALSRFPAACGAPESVFNSAQRVGLGLELEAMAVHRAVQMLPQIPGDAYLAVNLSPATALLLPDQVFTGPGVDLNRLVVEVTETAAVNGYEELRNRVAPLRERGLRVAVDDAGAGFASLHHIVELRPDIIKIDRSLIQGMAADHSRRSAVRAVVTLAEDLGAATVAEGVDSPADLDAAWELGISCAQGYLLGWPSTDPAGLARPREWAGGNGLVRPGPAPGGTR